MRGKKGLFDGAVHTHADELVYCHAGEASGFRAPDEVGVNLIDL
jgi:hypothetical protein